MILARIRKHFPASAESAAFTLELELQTTAGITVLFGPSGAGKTLTLDCIAGFVRPVEGRILLDDAILFDGATEVHLPPQARQCGYVFQNYALFPHMTLRENLTFAADRLPRLERHRRVNEMIERFRLTEVAGRKPHELSGGQKQRCSIARALLAAPKLLLLDEPARGLDAPLRTELYAVLHQVRAEFGTPILMVTHDLSECFELAESMVVLHEGRLVQTGPPARILEQPASVDVARLLGLYNLFPVEVKSLDPGNNSCRLRFGDWDLNGPYLPGRLLGDRVTLYMRPEQLTALPRDGRPLPNQIPATLDRIAELPQSVRLEFAGGIHVEMTRAGYERHRHNKEWVVEFPKDAVRVL
ncbi:MAG: ATP-binding cassette domain-containing protein [Acidobacteriia bacterium]|nr:ATP-binding cassette domain-containing protein [Terriglobia bacterium]